MEPVTSQDPRLSVLLASINDLKPKTRQLETTFFFVKIVSEMEGFPQKKESVKSEIFRGVRWYQSRLRKTSGSA